MTMEVLADWVSKVSNVVWNGLLLYLLVGTGIVFTIRTRFVQVRKFGAGWKHLFGHFSLNGEKAGKDGMSPFQALTTAIAAQVGTGNIAGAATALYSGGPGAIFWMWLSAFFGMSTIYGEAVLAQKYKTTDDKGHVTGGPIYYIRARFTGKFGKFLAGFFSIAIIFALGFTGNMVQANSISVAFNTAFGAPMIVVGIICAIIAAFIFLGGVGRIAAVTEKVVPIMAMFYMLGCVVILCINHAAIIPAFKSIFVAAFDPQAILGGAAGITVRQAMRYGVARGLFSNESGLGSAPIVASAASTRNPAQQALVAMTGTFWSTVVICALTGIVLVSTMLANPDIASDILANPTVYSGAMLASEAVAKIPYIGTPILVLGMVAFSYTTILGWSYYGNRCITYLFGRYAIRPYQVVYVAVAFLGAIGVGDIVWTISDIGNALMAIPNIIVVLLLSGMIARETRHYVYDGNLDEPDDAPIPQLEGK